MSKPVIQVKNISKAYRIGMQDAETESLGQAVFQWLKSPLRNLRRLRNLSRFELNKQEEDVLWALKNVSFEVNQGEVLGIVGKNGAGKSTLLKVLSQVTPPTLGEIRMKGRVASLLEVGTGFNPELTGRENVYLNGTILGMTKAEVDEKYDEIIEFSGVEKFIDTPVKRYSSGMKVRLAFAVAAHLDPEILVIDEVLAVGDAEFQRRCLGKMQDVAQGGRTVLFVSHNMPAVSSLCTRAVLMQQGELVFSGDVQDVINRYLQAQTERSETPLAEQTERKGNGVVRFEEIGFSLMPEDPMGNTLYVGQTGYIHLSVQVQDTEKLDQASFVIVVQDRQHQVLATLHTRFTGKLLGLKTGKQRVTCSIPKVSMIPGKYWVTVRCMLGGESGGTAELTDHIDQAAFFFVEGGDFYGSGKIPNQKHGTVMLEHSWEVYD